MTVNKCIPFHHLTPKSIMVLFLSPDTYLVFILLGSLQGLRLLLNVEQYEYTHSLTETTGVKVILHDHLQYPPGSHKEFVLGPGQHTFVEIQMTKVETVFFLVVRITTERNHKMLKTIRVQ